MVHAEQDVLDAELEVGTCDRQQPARHCDFDPGLRRPDQRGGVRPVAHLHPHQHVRDGGLQPHELDAFAGQPAAARFNQPALDERVRQLPQRRLRDVAHVVWEFQHHRQAHPSEQRRAP